MFVKETQILSLIFFKYLMKNEISCLTCALLKIKGECPFPSVTGSETTGSLCNGKKVCRL